MTDSANRGSLGGEKAKAVKPKDCNRASSIKATLNAWAVNLGMEPRTLETRLRKADVELERFQELSARDVIRALMGDKEAETIRNLKADADRKEREEQEARGELVKWPEVEERITKTMILPLRQWIVTLPTTLDTRCNPREPAIARVALNQAVDEALAMLRSGTNKEQ